MNPSWKPSPRQVLPFLLILFVGSGCSGLIYEIVWFQMLQLWIGSSAVSLGVLLGTFMGGMCLGSLTFSKVISERRHPLRVYALLELGIGIIGLVLLFGMPYVGRLYTTNLGHGLGGILWRGLICGMCLLPPTVLMGATLPAIARWTKTTPRGVSWLGLFYGGNIAGAVFGCSLAGFYLLRVHDIATATYVAAIINGTVACLGWGLAMFTAYQPASEDPPVQQTESTQGAWAVYLTIGLSGLCALGSQVIWTRQLSLMLGATVYTFSIILAVFLSGLGIGSSLGAYLSSTAVRPRTALGWCQWLIALSILWTGYMLSNSLPYWPVEPAFATNPWVNFQFDVVRCLWAIFPATCLWGASFPLALAAVRAGDRDPGKLVGRVYAANTVGAIVGALSFSVLLVTWTGVRTAQQVLIGLSGCAAFLMFGWLLWRARSQDWMAEGVRVKCWDPLKLAGLMGVVTFLAWSVPEAPPGLIAYGRNFPSWVGLADYHYVGEGMNASIAVSELIEGGERNFHVSGKIVASNEPQDMKLQRLLGHISALVHRRPRSVLVVGCGAGVTAGTFVLYPDVERIVICEIEPLIPAAAAKYFKTENYNVVDDPRAEVVLDDARHYIRATDEKFDIITSDPIHPWVKGAAALYSKEYFELCKQHLNTGGLVTQWVPLYETSLEAVKSEVATFMEVFPGGTIWSNEVEGGGYDIVLLGQAGKTTIDVDELHRRLGRDDHLPVLKSLKEIRLGSAMSLLGAYAGQGADLGRWLEGAQINRDLNLRLQYLAGMGLNAYREEGIYQSILGSYRYPEKLFIVSDQRERTLRRTLERVVIRD